jgi:hypothetical protein
VQILPRRARPDPASSQQHDQPTRHGASSSVDGGATASDHTDEVEQIARRAGCTRLSLITTNDNLDALRFCQRRGFRVAALHPGAVDEAGRA